MTWTHSRCFYYLVQKTSLLCAGAREIDDEQDRQLKWIVCYLVTKSMGIEQGKEIGIIGSQS